MITINPPNKKMKHNYTSELELKALLIRIKNKRLGLGTPEWNTRINKYVKWHTAINAKKYAVATKRNIVKTKLKKKIVELSEQTCSDDNSYERFGEIILLMIKKILTKPSFSGYTYKDDFYSDAIYKILKYLNNFDHTKISERTGINVNAFAYISQIMHNSILYIINTKKKESSRMKTYVNMQHSANQANMKDYSWHVADNPSHGIKGSENITKLFYIDKINTDLITDVNIIIGENQEADKLEIHYPSDYVISFDEYNEVKVLAKVNIIVQRMPLDETEDTE